MPLPNPVSPGRQFNIRADGYGSPMPPANKPTPTPTPTATATPKPTPTPAKPKKLYVGRGSMPEYKPVGSGNSAAVGGFLGGGGGNFGSLL
jgi:hypothetical protein